MKDRWTIVYYAAKSKEWATRCRGYDTTTDAAEEVAALMVANARPIVVEEWRAPVLVAVLNSTKEELVNIVGLL